MGFIPINFTMINKKKNILRIFITWSTKFLLIFKNAIATACLLSNFLTKTKRSEIIFRDLLKSVEKTDSQIISWPDSKLKNTRGTTLVECLSHSNLSNIEMLLPMTYSIFSSLI